NSSEVPATSINVTLTAGASLGNTVIVTFSMLPLSGAVSCSDSRGNTYSNDADVMNGVSGSGIGVRTVICSTTVTNALGASDTITITHPLVTARAISATEFSGIDTSASLDRTATNTGSGPAHPSSA